VDGGPIRARRPAGKPGRPGEQCEESVVKVEHVEVLVEEPSMEVFLRALLPKLLGERVGFSIYPHQSKHDLLAKLPGRLKGYAAWLPEDHRIMVIVDRDDDDCRKLKRRLDEIAHRAGLHTFSRAEVVPWYVVNRLVIEELEAWYFGDWEAVRKAYPRVPGTIPAKAQFRDPDAIRGGTWETFERVMQKAGYFKGGLRKTEAARAIAAHVEPERNRSSSFQVLYRTFTELAAAT